MNTFLLLIGGSLMTATPSMAATFVTQPFTQTVSEASVIARGKIGTSHTEWGKDADDTPRLYTYYELQTSEVLKGDAPPGNWTIRELGGVKEGVEMHVTGTAQFAQGEDVVVFLRIKNAEGSFDMHGMMMGKFNVKTDANGTEYLDGPAIATDATASTWTLDGVRGEIAKQKESSSYANAVKISKTTELSPMKGQPVKSGYDRGIERNLASSTQPLVPSWMITVASGLLLAFIIERILRKKFAQNLKKR